MGEDFDSDRIVAALDGKDGNVEAAINLLFG